MNNPIPKPRRVWRKRRFEREHSNSLWQADFKLTEQDEWMISYLDDHSRFVPGSSIHHNPTAKHAIKLLEESVNKYGKPDQVLTDRGTQFYPARGGVSEFTEFCTGNGIEHIVASVRRPSTIGKVSLPQGIRLRSVDLPDASSVRELLELRAPTSRNRLSVSSRRILQRPPGHIIVDRTQQKVYCLLCGVGFRCGRRHLGVEDRG
jgi:transposase InsO family protein